MDARARTGGRGPRPVALADRVSGGPHAVTISVADIRCTILCAYPKPILWATELHPEFVTDASPDVTVTVTYEQGYWDRGLPWLAEDTVSDRVVASGDDAGLTLTTADYRAQRARDSRDVAVSMAEGFRVDGLLRTLYTSFLLERGGLLVEGDCVADSAGWRLRVGAAAGARRAFIAVVPSAAGIAAYPTPFGDPGVAAPPSSPAMLDAIVLPLPAHRSTAAAAGALSAHVCVVDHRPPAVRRVLDAVARVLEVLDAPAVLVTETRDR